MSGFLGLCTGGVRVVGALLVAVYQILKSILVAAYQLTKAILVNYKQVACIGCWGVMYLKFQGFHITPWAWGLIF
jgi:hypothetical protein